MARAKRHHYVPAKYLARFGQDDTVLVRHRNPANVHKSHVKNVAVEGGFYEMTDVHGQPSDALEVAMSKHEGTALRIMDAIVEGERVPQFLSDDRAMLAFFLALQITRTPETRERIMFPMRLAAYAGDREIDLALMAEFLEGEHLGFKPKPREVEGALVIAREMLRDREWFTQDNAIRLSFAQVETISEVLIGMCWSLEIARKPRLVTSDSPLVVWRTPTPRDQFEGFGLQTAEEVRFPISPGAQILLTPAPREAVARIEPERVRACNADMALGCYRMVVGHPLREKQLRELELPKKRPVLRFNIGHGIQTNPDGTEEPMGDVVHAWVPRR